MTWNPAQYLQFANERLRPAVDLLARVGLEAPRSIVDLGCGAGNVTRLLAARWPQAQIVGVDSSAAMLDTARREFAGEPRVSFVEANIATWQPSSAVDLVYSNAALHWIDGHATLLPRIATMVAPGGCLAVQMPDNFRAPSHAAITTLAQDPRWQAKLAPLLRDSPTAAPETYYSCLAPFFATLDIWTTEYLQVLPARDDGEHAVAAWTRGTWLPPFLAALDADAQQEFLAAYRARMAAAYPPRADGRTLFPFQRLFIVANR